MTDTYLLLLAAYAQRDRYVLMMFGLAAALLYTDKALATWPKIRLAYRGYILLAWVGMLAYVFLFSGGKL